MSTVTDRPKGAGPPYPAITIAVTVEGDEPFTQDDVDYLLHQLRGLAYAFHKAGFYGVYGGDVPRKFGLDTLPEPYTTTSPAPESGDGV